MPQDEKRVATRYVCDGGVEIKQPGKHGFWGTVCDISEGGCYVQTFEPLATGTQVAFRIQARGREFHGSGTIQASHPGVGMGMFFFAVDDGQRAILKNLLAELEAEKAHQSGETIVGRDSKAHNW
jgi:hypothetical protein